MAVKVYTPGQFYAAGGVVEEMFYQEVGIAGVVKVKVNGLVALLKLITGVAIKSMV